MCHCFLSTSFTSLALAQLTGGRSHRDNLVHVAAHRVTTAEGSGHLLDQSQRLGQLPAGHSHFVLSTYASTLLSAAALMRWVRQ